MAYDLSIAQLRDTAAQLKATNATVAAGRLCKETDTDKWKVGTGAAYNSTGYTLLDGDEERSADDVYAAMTVSDGRDEAGSGTVTGIHHGPYVAGLTLNLHDTVSREEQIFEWQGTETVSTNWATDATNFGLAIGASPQYVTTAIAAAVPKRYKWIGDGAAATGTVVANTLGVTINVTNPATGTYVFTAASGTPFLAAKTTISVQNRSNGGLILTVDSRLQADSVVTAYFKDPAGDPTDPTAYQVNIEAEP